MIIFPPRSDRPLNIPPHDELKSDTVTMSDGTEVENTPEALQEYHNMIRRTQEETFKQYNEQQKALETGRRCPVNSDSCVRYVPCRRDCALFVGDSCALATRPGKVDTSGKPCPLRRTCDNTCALFVGAGCALI